MTSSGFIAMISLLGTESSAVGVRLIALPVGGIRRGPPQTSVSGVLWRLGRSSLGVFRGGHCRPSHSVCRLREPPPATSRRTRPRAGRWDGSEEFRRE
jgi:hypothetical protein